MSTWPTGIGNPEQLGEKNVKKIKRQTSSAGYTMSSSAATLTKKQFSLSWSLLDNTEKGLMETFFDTTGGASFTWTNPTDDVEYTVLFGQDDLTFKHLRPSYWQSSIIFLEV